jgi:hypothetical protein
MAKKPSTPQPGASQDEEMIVTIVKFRGSGESVRKGIDAVTQALSGAFGAPAIKQIGNGRRIVPQIPDPIDDEPTDIDTTDEGKVQEEIQENGASAPPAAKPKKALYTFMDGLNLSPAGKKPWKDYATEKKPDGFNERLLVASAWLQTEGGLQDFAGGELFTCFRAMDWPTQNDMTNTMRKLKSTKSYYANPEFGKWRLTQPGLDAAAAVGSKKE